ncbi:hypothetical protein N510_002285 [Firmicutes bacterium ASF500]|nr:hypothetical protein N510_002285 [Firmicutes bacterium ASF500]
MKNILYQLFSGDYDITPERDEKQQELSEAALVELEKIAAVFGVEFVDHLCDLNGEREEWQNFQYYRSGFLLGVRLMLEALGPVL